MDIYIFYDFESVHISKKESIANMTNCLRNALEKFGTIVDKRVYFDCGSKTENARNRIDLNQSAWHVVDCPHIHGKKETVDKKILMDIAFSPLMTNTNAMVCLISNDGDFCDILSRLRDRKIYTLVVFTEGAVCQNLMLTVDSTLNMQTDIMGNRSDAGKPKNMQQSHFENLDGCKDLLGIIFEISHGDCNRFLPISTIAERWYLDTYGNGKVLNSEYRRAFRKIRDQITQNDLANLSPSKLEICLTRNGIEFIKNNLYNRFD